VHVLTIGHSTRSIEEFIALLKAHAVERLVDIRTVPKSRRNPQFHTDALAASLAEAGIEYIHMRELGGLRHPRKDSTNSAWRNDSFRGYADYMQTPAFDDALDRLLELAGERRTTVMCAEAVPWRCHRSLVADALTARRHDVHHIMSDTRLDRHKLTPFARVERERVTYPGVV
jgi:uncharacterized protein (DUF488 family)